MRLNRTILSCTFVFFAASMSLQTSFAAPSMDKEKPRVVRDETVKPRLDQPIQCQGGNVIDGKCVCTAGTLLVKVGENKYQCKKI